MEMFQFQLAEHFLTNISFHGQYNLLNHMNLVSLFTIKEKKIF